MYVEAHMDMLNHFVFYNLFYRLFLLKINMHVTVLHVDKLMSMFMNIYVNHNKIDTPYHV